MQIANKMIRTKLLLYLTLMTIVVFHGAINGKPMQALFPEFTEFCDWKKDGADCPNSKNYYRYCVNGKCVYRVV